MTLDHIDGLLLDMDGVLGVSWQPYPGAAARPCSACAPPVCLFVS